VPGLDDQEARALVAQGCRILAMEGLVEGILGHVSVRGRDGSMLIRCRGPQEKGLVFSASADVRRMSLDGTGEELSDGWDAPKEWPIHAELYRRRPEVGAVVHAHPPASVAVGLAGLALRPIFGAFNIPAMRLGLEGVPVYPRPVLITRLELAKEMAEAMGYRPCCLLVGHGVTAVGPSVQAAVTTALNLEALAKMTLQMAVLGARPDNVAPRDLEELPDLGSSFNDDTNWRYLCAKESALSHRHGAEAGT